MLRCPLGNMNTLLPIGDWIPDPRLEALGQRMVLPARDKATSPSREPETEGYEFRAWRIEHGIAEGDTEMTSGEQTSHVPPTLQW